MSKPNILVTGAGGQLGKLVIDQLIARTPTNRVAALVRSASQADALNRLGVEAAWAVRSRRRRAPDVVGDCPL
jgi:NAD(P)H dehydrogenase (quinone)